jgi:hypothetical protein
VIGEVSYKLLVLNILNFSIDLNSFTWIEKYKKVKNIVLALTTQLMKSWNGLRNLSYA